MTTESKTFFGAAAPGVAGATLAASGRPARQRAEPADILESTLLTLEGSVLFAAIGFETTGLQVTLHPFLRTVESHPDDISHYRGGYTASFLAGRGCGGFLVLCQGGSSVTSQTSVTAQTIHFYTAAPVVPVVPAVPLPAGGLLLLGGLAALGLTRRRGRG